MIDLEKQLIACVQNAIEASANNTTLIPQAQQVHVKRLKKNVVRISLKLPKEPWQLFNVTVTPVKY